MTWPQQRGTIWLVLQFYLAALGAGLVFSFEISQAAPVDPEPQIQLQAQDWRPVGITALRSKLAVEWKEERPVRKRPHVRRRYVLPVDRDLLSPSELVSPHHDYPAWDVGLAYGTPVVSIEDGYVTQTHGSGRCGIGLEVRGTDGAKFTYCHGSAVLVSSGTVVKAGDVIMASGNSGHSTGPHLHLQITSPSGVLVCPQTLLMSWYSGIDMAPASASSSGCYFATSDPEAPIESSGDPQPVDIPTPQATLVTTIATASPAEAQPTPTQEVIPVPSETSPQT